MELLPGVRGTRRGIAAVSAVRRPRARFSASSCPEVAVEEMEIRTATSRMDLYLAVEPTVTGWRAAAEYSTDTSRLPGSRGWLESWHGFWSAWRRIRAGEWRTVEGPSPCGGAAGRVPHRPCSPNLHRTPRHGNRGSPDWPAPPGVGLQEAGNHRGGPIAGSSSRSHRRTAPASAGIRRAVRRTRCDCAGARRAC